MEHLSSSIIQAQHASSSFTGFASPKPKAYTTVKMVGIALSSDNYKQLITEVWKPFLDTNFQDNTISGYSFEFHKFSSQVLLITIKTNQVNHISKLQAEIREISNRLNEKYALPEITGMALGWYSIHENNTVFCNDFYIPHVSYILTPQARLRYDLIAQKSAHILTSLLTQSAEENLDELTIQHVLPMQVILALSILRNPSDVLSFYQLHFDKLLHAIEIEDVDIENWRKYFLETLDTTFQNQADIFIPYIESIVETMATNGSFEEEWLDDWKNTCQSIARDLTDLNIPSAKTVHDATPVALNKSFLLSSIELINNQLCIEASYEFNLYYIIIHSFYAIRG